MKVSKRQIKTVHLIWLLIVPAAFYIAYSYFPSNEYDYFYLAISLLIVIAIMRLTIIVQNTVITLEKWVIFSVFFQYGLLAEMVFMQIAVLTLLFTSKSATPNLFKFTFNSIHFAITSLVSSAIFYAVGGSSGQMELSKLVLAGFIYASAYSLINCALLYFSFTVLRTDTSAMKKATLWDYIVSILLLPFAIVFSFLLEQLGNQAFLLIGVPFLLVLIVTRNYMESNQLNDVLASAAEIGHQLADRLGVEDVLLTFIDKIKRVIPYDSAYIVDLRMSENLVLLAHKEGEFRSGMVTRISFPQKRCDGDGLEVEVTKLFLNKKSVASLKGYTFDSSVESVLTAPIKRNQKTEGFLILTSNQRYAFEEVHVQMVDLLTGYFATAVEKARYYERTVEKSVRCGLTGLYNYRYLESKLDEEMVRYHTSEISTLSTIILDIDHFKSINDTYGHQSGNDLLCAFAALLRKYQTSDMTLARYGGEEFVMILPNYEKEDAIKLAETIRKEMEESSFKIIPDLSEEREPTIINMTVSIGVATMPMDAKDGKELLRNADRALYIGGKQAGRNRVGIYEEEKENVVS
ncbi:sensor domain-containing diguanylate cyclase [Sporosarcina sp. Marseille-Q4943]|uniref:sensor domain-containing diguanylate cyclase n=1 Tax=Sporosarcina sp. Marseille-Q4943 TaxID=2942204 RepID=UPI00208DD08F|nr:GGDEF domain-containing protein [Sporosarcina sp. Marseille-Q4943]